MTDYKLLCYLRNLCDTANQAYLEYENSDYFYQEQNLDKLISCYDQIRTVMATAKIFGLLVAIAKDKATGLLNLIIIHNTETDEVLESEIKSAGHPFKTRTFIAYATAKNGTWGNLERKDSLYSPWGYGDLAWIFYRKDLYKNEVV